MNEQSMVETGAPEIKMPINQYLEHLLVGQKPAMEISDGTWNAKDKRYVVKNPKDNVTTEYRFHRDPRVETGYSVNTISYKDEQIGGVDRKGNNFDGFKRTYVEWDESKKDWKPLTLKTKTKEFFRRVNPDLGGFMGQVTEVKGHGDEPSKFKIMVERAKMAQIPVVAAIKV